MKNTQRIAFAILTIAGTAALGSGFIAADEKDYKAVPLTYAPIGGASVELPRKVDLSAKLPPPGDQGDQPSCVGWAVGYGMASYYRFDGSTPMSPSFIYNNIKQGPGCNGGSRLLDGVNILSGKGSVSISRFPYDPLSCTKPDAATHVEATRNRVYPKRRIEPRSRSDVKAFLKDGLPIVVGLDVGPSFYAHKGITPLTTAERTDGHAVLIVGYDDDLKAYKIFNSQGAGWGIGGFGWISYELFEGTAREAYIFTIKRENTPKSVALTPVSGSQSAILGGSLTDATVSDLRLEYVNLDDSESLVASINAKFPASLINKSVDFEAFFFLNDLMKKGELLPLHRELWSSIITNSGSKRFAQKISCESLGDYAQPSEMFSREDSGSPELAYIVYIYANGVAIGRSELKVTKFPCAPQ
ncbi:C1 family peptidase [Corallococcus macrosporus]|uniref:C1 family peptidase n=1 Tax=Corallococcus macrosporus TaxID=35 RepID=A0ABS3D4B3_9BACT|nr:C1 family peptidase [Corallococcus macrosporus]MBN8226503.1 C1 family peptidase [Corallococcus macrosporus]